MTFKGKDRILEVKREAMASTMRKTGFGTGCGPVLRQATE